MSAEYRAATDSEISNVLTQLERNDLPIADLSDAYLDYCTWAHDTGSPVPKFLPWLLASGWLE